MFKILRSDSDDVPEVALTVSNRTLFRIIIVVVVTLALIAAVLKVKHALLLIFISFFLALALNAPVARLARVIPGKRRGSRSIATTLSFLIVVLAIGIFAAYMIPPLVHQTERFVAASPTLVNDVKNQNSSLGRFIRSHHLQNTVNNISKQLGHWASGESGRAFSGLTGIASSIVSTLTVLALTFMMLIEGPRWLMTAKEVFVPTKHTRRVERLTADMYKVVKGYVNGQVALAFIAAVLIAPALFMLHVSYPVALMVVVFLCGLIPMIGHTIGAIIVTTVALFHSLTAAIIILAYYIVYMQVENYLLQPRIQANTTNMSPLLVFSSIVIGIDFGGLLGGLVAIPIAACLKVLVVDYLDAKNLLPEIEASLNHKSSKKI